MTTDKTPNAQKRPRGRPRLPVSALKKTTAIGFRIGLQLEAKLDFVCTLDSVGRSEFARRAVEKAIAERLKEAA